MNSLKLHMHTYHLVHNWGETWKAACTQHNFCKGLKIWVKITPHIKIKPYTAIIFLQQPESLASSCKTITHLKHNEKMLREVYSSYIFSLIQWQHDNLVMTLQPTLLYSIRRPWLFCKYKTVSQLRCVEHLLTSSHSSWLWPKPLCSSSNHFPLALIVLF